MKKLLLLSSLFLLTMVGCAQQPSLETSTSNSSSTSNTSIETTTSETTTSEVQDKVSCAITLSSPVELDKKEAGSKLYKFSKKLSLNNNDEFKIELSINDTKYSYGFKELKDINNVSNKEYNKEFFTLGTDDSIKVSLTGNYSIYVIIEKDKKATINIDVNDFEIPIIPYREAYFVGEGNFNNGGSSWSTDSGIKGTDMNDNPSAKEKYSFNVDLDKNDKFMFTLKDTAIWYGYSSFVGITNKTTLTNYSKVSDFFEANDSNNVIVKYSGNYTFYLSVWKNDTADIWVDVENFEVPPTTDVITVTTEGLTTNLTFKEISHDSEWEKYKFDSYSTFTKNDEFKIKVTINDVVNYVGFSNIEGHAGDITSLPEDFITEGENNSIHLSYNAGITFIVTGKLDGTIAIWYNVYSIQLDETPSLEPGCYVEGLWGQNANKTSDNDAPSASENIIHKYEAYGFFYHDDILTIKIVDKNKTYEFKYSDIKEQNKGSETLPEGNFLREGDDGKIQVINNCDLTFYLIVYDNDTIAIYATLWNIYNN